MFAGAFPWRPENLVQFRSEWRRRRRQQVVSLGATESRAARELCRGLLNDDRPESESVDHQELRDKSRQDERNHEQASVSSNRPAAHDHDHSIAISFARLDCGPEQSNCAHPVRFNSGQNRRAKEQVQSATNLYLLVDSLRAASGWQQQIPGKYALLVLFLTLHEKKNSTHIRLTLVA